MEGTTKKIGMDRNEADRDTASYRNDRYAETSNEKKRMIVGSGRRV